MPELIELAKYVVIDDGLKGYQIWDRVFWDDGSGERKHKRPELMTFAQKYGQDKGMIEEFRKEIIAAGQVSDLTGWEAIIKREFGRIVITGTMTWRRQMTRPAHEVALGVWLAGL